MSPPLVNVCTIRIHKRLVAESTLIWLLCGVFVPLVTLQITTFRKRFITKPARVRLLTGMSPLVSYQVALVLTRIIALLALILLLSALGLRGVDLGQRQQSQSRIANLTLPPKRSQASPGPRRRRASRAHRARSAT